MTTHTRLPLLPAALLTLLSVVCCRPAAEQSRPTIPYVRNIISGAEAHGSAAIRGSLAPDVHADIAVIGFEEQCVSCLSSFLSYDGHDNVSGTAVPDGLPDFAGETFCAVEDRINSSCRDLFHSRGLEKTRELPVRLLVGALDTLYHLSPYDLEGLGHKLPAKMVVMADPYFCAFDRHDVDTLLRSFGSAVTVLYPIELAVEKIAADAAGRSSLTIGVMCDKVHAGTPVYGNIIADAGIKGADVYAQSVAGSPDPFIDFLDKYAADSLRRPFDYIILDDPSLNPVLVEDGCARVSSVMSPESMTYSRHISKEGFKLLNVSDILMQTCFRALRRENLFTHNIAYPSAYTYVTVPSPEENAAQDNIWLIPSTSYVQD